MDTHLKAALLARKGIEKVRLELLDPTPDSVDRCNVPLQGAIACMTELSSHLARRAPNSGNDARLRAELLHLRRDLAGVHALLQSAASFYTGYGRLLQSGASECLQDYSPAARVANLRAERNFVVHG